MANSGQMHLSQATPASAGGKKTFMDSDLLAFVTGLDPEDAQDYIQEDEPNQQENKSKKKRSFKKNKELEKVAVTEVSTKTSNHFDVAGLADFTSVLADETSFAGLKRKIGDIADEGDLEKLGLEGKGKSKTVKVVETPLPKVQADRIERQVAYEHTSKDITKWQPIINKNRQAKTLSFPMNAPPSHTVTSSSMAVNHAPKTEFELELQQTLEQVGVATEADISKFEEMEMNKLSAAEVEARINELAKKRALLFFQERKSKHQSKIKSKKYRKIKGKERAKEEAIKESQLSLQERREKAELARAKERLTLKTRKANKWAQEMIHRRGLESGSRQEIVEQLRDKERLRQEIFGKAADYNSDEEYEDDELLLRNKDDEHFEGVSGEEDEVEEDVLSEHGIEEGSDFTDSEEDEEQSNVVGRRKFGEISGKLNMTEEDISEELENSKRSKKSSNKASLFEVDSQETKQQEIIKQAFAGDDLFAEFKAEKEAIEEADAPKVQDLTLPGWGSWAGQGVPEKEQKTKILKLPAPGEGISKSKRKDSNLQNVIINEKQNKRLLQTWMVPKVPFPYTSQEEYEKATRSKPLGPEWNTATTYRKRVEPRVQVKVGSIIDPIKFVKQPKL